MHACMHLLSSEYKAVVSAARLKGVRKDAGVETNPPLQARAEQNSWTLLLWRCIPVWFLHYRVLVESPRAFNSAAKW